MPNRTLCAVLEAMRKCYETRNFSYLPGLIEEGQMMANRMESSLYDKEDVETYGQQASVLRKEVKELRREKAELKGEDDEDRCSTD